MKKSQLFMYLGYLGFSAVVENDDGENVLAEGVLDKEVPVLGISVDIDNLEITQEAFDFIKELKETNGGHCGFFNTFEKDGKTYFSHVEQPRFALEPKHLSNLDVTRGANMQLVEKCVADFEIPASFKEFVDANEAQKEVFNAVANDEVH